MSLYSSLLLSSIINSSRLYRPHELRFVSVVSAMRIARAVLSVSRSYSSRDSTKRTTRSNSTTKKKLKKREKGAHKTYRLWCPLLERTRRRSHSKARKVVRSWCVNGSKCARARLNFVRFEKRLFFKANAFSFETPSRYIYACALNATTCELF